MRNPEVRRVLLLQLILGVCAGAAGFALDARAGHLALTLAAAYTLIYLIATARRYKRLCALSESVDRILHGDQGVSLEMYTEGELAVLHSEIYKMTVRLREQQQKLTEEKVHLADSMADISHQIRTPLTSINLMVQLLKDPQLSAERRQALMRELQGMLSRIDWLITALLKLSRLDAGTVRFKAEQLPLERLIELACRPLLIPMELRGQTLEVRAQGSFTGDVHWTCEALGNILKNSMEHTPPGGRIEIEAAENALYAQILIRDSGAGIADADLPHIFERFYKGKDSDEKSFGVGLALARVIIKGQNGGIKAENGPCGGAMFTIRFYKGTV